MTVMSPPYCQSTGRVASRVMEAAAYTDVAARCIRGNKAHPEHSVICRFRTGNREGFKEMFTKALVMAQETGCLKKVGNIGVEGVKIHANAGERNAASRKRAVEMMGVGKRLL